MKKGIIRLNRFKDGLTVFTPNYYLNRGKKTISDLIDRGISFKKLSDVTDEIYQGGIFKRVFVESDQNSFKYVTATDMIKTQPKNTSKKISKKYTPWIEKMTLQEEQILVSCAGTVGNISLVNKSFKGCIGSQEIIRIETEKISYGYLYAYLSTPIINDYIQSMIYGAVVPRISPIELGQLPVLLPSENQQEKIHKLIVESSSLLAKANIQLEQTENKLKNEIGLRHLKPEDYDFFGSHSSTRSVSTFKRNISEIRALTINAFNYSSRLQRIKNEFKKIPFISLAECIEGNNFFTTGAFRRLEIDSDKSIKLLNQSDIFNFKKKGKMLSRRYVNSDNLVEYGEILIAGVGTLGESETFCRAIFANEELEGQLVAGEFIRMKTSKDIPSGYLFSWLSSEYGFRFIRSTQTGTKLCRPIQELLKEVPVPILDKDVMQEIDTKVKEAHTMIYQALLKENDAIALVEKEIEQWEK